MLASPTSGVWMPVVPLFAGGPDEDGDLVGHRPLWIRWRSAAWSVAHHVNVWAADRSGGDYARPSSLTGAGLCAHSAHIAKNQSSRFAVNSPGRTCVR